MPLNDYARLRTIVNSNPLQLVHWQTLPAQHWVPYMCMFSQPEYPDPEKPKEYAAQQQPDNAAVRSAAGRRASDQITSAPETIATSPRGVTGSAQTERSGLVPGVATTILTSPMGLMGNGMTDQKTLLGA